MEYNPYFIKYVNSYGDIKLGEVGLIIRKIASHRDSRAVRTN